MAIGVSAQPGEADSILGGDCVMVSGTAVSIDTISSVTMARLKEIILQADSANTVDVLIGDSANQTVHIPAGASITLVISDPKKIFVKPATGSSATLHFLARV